MAAVAGCATMAEETEAGAEFKEASNEQPRVARLLRFCQRLRDAGDYAVAVGMCRRAHELNPESVEPVLLMAQTLQAMGNNREAASAYRTVLKMDAMNAEARIGLGRAYIGLKQYEMAQQTLESALEVDDQDHRVYNALGVINDLANKHEAAQVYYRSGLELDPENVSLRSNLGLSLSLTGQHAEAIALLSGLVNDHDADATSRQNLALAYGMAGNMTAAETVGRIDLPAPAVANNLDYYAENRTQAEVEAAPTQMAAAEPVEDPSDQGRPAELAWSIDDFQGLGTTETITATPKSRPAGQTPDQPPAEPNLVIADLVGGAEAQTAPVEPMVASLAEQIPVASPWGDALPETTDRDTFDGTLTAELRGGQEMGADGPVDTSVAAVDPDAPMPMHRGAGRLATAGTGSSTNGTHGVQLGAYTDGSRVYEGWRELQGRAPAQLGNLLPSIERVERADGGVIFRLRTQAVGGRADADRLCEDLKTNAVDCMVVPVAGSTTTAVAAAAPATETMSDATDAPPKPAVNAKPESEIGVLSRSEHFAVQLGAFRDSARSDKAWRDLNVSAPDLLAGVEKDLRRADLGPDKGVYYRLRTQPMASREGADNLCLSLMSRGIECVVVRVPNTVTSALDS